jgi:UDP-GlcNAc:undecaprenyl-phosphate GlcNAc-1-phosphate transferase
MELLHPTKILLVFIISVTIAAVILPVIKALADKLGLLDKPNARKVHTNPVPVIGGLGIGITLILSLIINPSFIEILTKYYMVISTSLLLMLVGIIDDKLNLKAIHRLGIQLVCAYALAASGIRLTSLFGVFGIHTLNIFESYTLTIFLIVGVVNAFNLIDGIDGLAGFLALIGLSIFGYKAYLLQDTSLVIILVSLIGSVLVFLKHNLSKNKIFLGDGGSLLLGLVLVSVGIQLIESSAVSSEKDVSSTISIVFGVFLIPVLDSLRVYWSRMQEGFSPFRADKRHIHHLFLFFKLSHHKASSTIAISAIGIITLIMVLFSVYGLSSAIFLVSILFLVSTSFLASIKELGDWKTTISELEDRD